MKHHLGNEGEILAQNFLKEKDYKILHTNWRSSYYEIDIIAKFENTLVIVEVKTRTSSAFGNPSDFVQTKKHQNLFKATEEYIHQHDYNGEIRFDIISIYKSEEKWIIEHYEDAFYSM